MVQFNFASIGTVLEQYRAKRNLTTRDIAEQLDISHVAYRDYELGKSNMNLDTFQKVCDILKIPVLDAIAGSTDKNITLPIAKAILEEMQAKIALHPSE